MAEITAMDPVGGASASEPTIELLTTSVRSRAPLVEQKD